MNTEYKCVTTVDGIRDYIGGSRIVAFDFETAPDDPYREEDTHECDLHGKPSPAERIYFRSYFKTTEKEQGTASAIICRGYASRHHRQSDFRLCAGRNRTV